MSSMPRLLAASISMISGDAPALIAWQVRHALHGRWLGSSCKQLIALASTRAVVVLPVPRGPLKRYAWATRSRRTAFCNVRTMCSWPTSSSLSKDWGRYLRYNDDVDAVPVPRLGVSLASVVVVADSSWPSLSPKSDGT